VCAYSPTDPGAQSDDEQLYCRYLRDINEEEGTMNQDRIVKQIDKMLKSGRIHKEEAAGLRATQGSAEFDRAVGEIRARHAGVHMDESIAAGQMSQERLMAISHA
jgi:hypothetical protein